MAAQYRPEFPAQVMRELTYPLTAGAVRPYYYDNTGNISTSHFRPSPPKGGKAILELSPRFPLLGGWKHEITVGWDVQLSEWLKSLGGDKKVLAVPFLTGLRGVVVDDAELIVTLPEGAK
jgi:oligosaccharyltransferase complex subunit alpha (ribophorin I)